VIPVRLRLKMTLLWRGGVEAERSVILCGSYEPIGSVLCGSPTSFIADKSESSEAAVEDDSALERRG
jgi:hypothetical protein